MDEDGREAAEGVINPVNSVENAGGNDSPRQLEDPVVAVVDVELGSVVNNDTIEVRAIVQREREIEAQQQEDVIAVVEMESVEESDESEIDNSVVMQEGRDEGEVAGHSVHSDDTDSTDEEIFDISLAASHSYMGQGMQPVLGRSILDPGWEGTVPVLAHHGAVFPGETVPMVLNHPHDTQILEQAIEQDKLFGLLCPDETGVMISGYGVMCEVFEATRQEAVLPALPPLPPVSGLAFKARAVHRFRFADMPKHSVPMHLYSRLRYEKVRVLPEIQPADPLRGPRLHSLDPHRRGRTALDRRLRSLDAAVTAWPLFVYDIFDYAAMRARIHAYFKTLFKDELPDYQPAEKLPSDPVSLSFWVARNLALAPRDRLALFVVDNALLRLNMAVRDIARKSVLCCSSCANEIARREHIFAMSSEGVHANYTNLGGYMHDIVTVSAVSGGGVSLTGAPSAEYSWFPGYCWTVAVCAACVQHVGWRFDASKRSLRPQQFWALCRNYVTPRAHDAHPLPPLAPYPLPSARYPLALALADDAVQLYRDDEP